MGRRFAVPVGTVPLALGGLAVAAERPKEPWAVPLGPKVEPAPFHPAPVKRELHATLKVHPARGAGVVLVQDGQPTCVLLLADQASGAAREAAETLRDGLKKMSGAEVVIARQRNVTLTKQDRGWSIRYEGRPVSCLVAIGDTKLSASEGLSGKDLPLEGYHIQTVGNVLLLVGSDARAGSDQVLEGTRHAALALLERHLGFRWLWPGELGEVVPHRATVKIAAVDEEDAPAIRQRTLRNYGYGHVEMTTVPADPKQPGSRLTKRPYLHHDRLQAGMKQLG